MEGIKNIYVSCVINLIFKYIYKSLKVCEISPLDIIFRRGRHFTAAIQPGTKPEINVLFDALVLPKALLFEEIESKTTAVAQHKSTKIPIY